MAIDKEKTYKKALKEAADPNVYFIEDVVALIGISKDSFYRLYPTGSDEYDAISDLLTTNRIKTKKKIRKKLSEGSKAPELIALYKLISTTEERKKLSSSYIDHTTNDKEIKPTQVINYNNLSEEALKEIIENSETPEEEPKKKDK